VWRAPNVFGSRRRRFIANDAALRKAKKVMLDTGELQAFSRLPSPLLTVYLNSNPGKPANRGPSPEYMTWLHSAAQSALSQLPRDQQRLFRIQVEHVQAFLRDRVSSARSELIFAGANSWTHMPLDEEIENELHWGKPFLFPLLALVSGDKPCGVVVVDRAGMRFFRCLPGKLVEVEKKPFDIDISQWKAKDMGKATHARESRLQAARQMKKTRGSARDIFEHRLDAQYRRLCGEIADRALVLSREARLDVLFLVGSERLVEPIAAKLPRDFRSRTVLIEEDLGRIPAPDIEEHIRPAIARWENDRQSQLVDELLADATVAVTGIDAALAELQKGTARALVVAQAFDSGLRQCNDCGWADRSLAEACPACGGARRMANLREVLPELAWNHGVEIEVISGNAAARLVRAGGIAAKLRQARKPGEKRMAGQTR
jgi:hypothetical protein